MKTKIKFVSLFLVLLTIFSLTACNHNDKDTVKDNVMAIIKEIPPPTLYNEHNGEPLKQKIDVHIIYSMNTGEPLVIITSTYKTPSYYIKMYGVGLPVDNCLYLKRPQPHPPNDTWHARNFLAPTGIRYYYQFRDVFVDEYQIQFTLSDLHMYYDQLGWK